MTAPTRPAADLSTESATWQATGTHTARLVQGGGIRADYHDGTDMTPDASPRPYLHPVRTAAGTVLTDLRPDDHVHHMGVSMALPVVNGTSFWGGRTYVRDQGSTMLDNHGRQQALSTCVGPAGLAQDLVYLDERGKPVLQERREIRHVDLDDAWALSWSSDLTAGAVPLRFDSPATNGRAGAGYGGILWRLGRSERTVVLSAGGTGEDVAHGSTSSWVAFVQHRGTSVATLVLVQPEPALPWFLRATEYDGACPAVAWDTPRHVPLGGTLHLGLVGVCVDRALDASEAAALADRALDTLAADALATAAAPTA